MRIYICDMCERVIKDPHNVKMKEFYLAADYDEYGIAPYPSVFKTKIHLCDECYKELKKIAHDRKMTAWPCE